MIGRTQDPPVFASDGDQPLLAFNSFLGLLFQINGCTQHAQHSATLAAAESAALEGLRGEGLTAQRRRLLIFRPLLGSMTGEHKLQTLTLTLTLTLNPHPNPNPKPEP